MKQLFEAAAVDVRYRAPMRLWSDLKPALRAAAPHLLALAVLGAGAMLLASGATPSEPRRFVRLLAVTPELLIDVSHFLSSVLGLLLVMLAFGLRARLDAAYAAAVAILLAAAPLTLLKGFNWEETAVVLAVAALLAPTRGAFFRPARLSRMEITPGWLFSAACVLAGAGLLGLWSYRHADYGAMSWWRVMADEDAERSLRAWAGAAIALIAFGVWRLAATAATPRVAGEADPEFQQVRAILAKAEVARPLSNLALLGDKRFLFSASGESFLMFGVRGRSWVALGGPVGRRAERMELVWRFRELADGHGARAAFYNIEADDLPDVVELGFAIQKIGESAVVPLESFSLSGNRRESLRRNWRKARDAGAIFEVVLPPDASPLLPDLQRISDRWLAQHAGGDKRFSLGGFEPRYVQEFPIALVRWEGRIIAFANIWTVAARTAFSMDLMRYSDEGPKNIMDFLFVELFEWGRAQGYAAFDFGMAPLAGLDDRPLAPMMSRVGRLIYERGEEIYNFQGVRRYKDKYDPLWQPRYVAARNRWAIPLVLADVGLLTSGGLAGLAKRPRGGA